MADSKPEEAAETSGGGKGKLIGIIVGALLLVGGSIGGTVFFMGGAQQAPVSAEGAVEEEAPRGDPRYLKLDPAFTVNLENSANLLRISIAVLVYGYEVEKVLAEHMPQIRNSLVLLFSSQDAATVRDRAGKEQLRQTTLDTLREIVGKYTEVDDMEVFFTGFVLQ